jgi:UDP-3-O-[3-hydroxymyristoyl] N-acetylglucosamine deacetylase
VDQVVFHGRGLHSGERCAVTLRRAPGPFVFEHEGEEFSRHELTLVRADRGVCVRALNRGFEVDLVEHLFAALAGLHVQSGIAVRVRGPELPLLDGAALEFAAAVRALDPPRSPPRLRVTRAETIEVGESRYEFRPHRGIRIELDAEFAEPLGASRATWDGSAAQFLREIAPARTFGWRSEALELRARGRAAHVDPDSVVVLEEDGSVLPPGRAPEPGELARHKLLDLLGDTYFYGGPPLGSVFAHRPGHPRTHAALQEALARELLAPMPGPAA